MTTPGGGMGSKWINNGSLYIGGNNTQAGGTGTVNISENGLVNVTGTTKQWARGTVNLDGGILSTDTLDLTAGGTFNMLDGLLRAKKIDGDINYQTGTISPGRSLGILTVTGDYTQGAAATLEIELGGDSSIVRSTPCASLPQSAVPRAIERLQTVCPSHT